MTCYVYCLKTNLSGKFWIWVSNAKGMTCKAGPRSCGLGSCTRHKTIESSTLCSTRKQNTGPFKCETYWTSWVCLFGLVRCVVTARTSRSRLLGLEALLAGQAKRVTTTRIFFHTSFPNKQIIMSASHCCITFGTATPGLTLCQVTWVVLRLRFFATTTSLPSCN